MSDLIANFRYFCENVQRARVASDEEFVTDATRSIGAIMASVRQRIRAMRMQLMEQKETIIGQLERIEELQNERDDMKKQLTIALRTADRLTKAKATPERRNTRR